MQGAGNNSTVTRSQKSHGVAAVGGCSESPTIKVSKGLESSVPSYIAGSRECGEKIISENSGPNC